MRVLLITDNHTPTGGAENYFLELKERLKQIPGMDVYSIGFGTEDQQGKDYSIYKAPQSNFLKLIWRVIFHPVVYFKLRQQIKKFQPDVIHLHNVKQYSVSVLRALRPYPVVQTVHDFSLICPTGQNIHKDLQPCETGLRRKCFWEHQVKFNRLIYLAQVVSFFVIKNRLRQVVKKFIVPSPLLVDYLKRNQFTEAAFIPPFKLEKNISSITPKPNHFLFAGNLGTHKGVYVLLDEFALALQKNNQLMLTIAGTGPEENAMRTRIKKLNIEKNVRFIGWKNDLSSFYAESTAVIFPSIGLESFGLIMTETMSYSRPLIGVNRGTAAWLIEENYNGLLFDPLKKNDLSEKILTLANDHDLAKKMGEQGYLKLQKLIDNEKTVNEIVNIYRSVVQ